MNVMVVIWFGWLFRERLDVWFCASWTHKWQFLFWLKTVLQIPILMLFVSTVSHLKPHFHLKELVDGARIERTTFPGEETQFPNAALVLVEKRQSAWDRSVTRTVWTHGSVGYLFDPDRPSLPAGS